MLNYSLCARIRVFSFSFSARIIPSKVIIFKKIMPKTHEILNGKRKGHPNFPCPGPKIVQWVKKLVRIIWGNMVYKLTGEKQSQTKAKITVETEALLTFVAMCFFLFQWRIWRWMTAALRNPTTWATRSRKFYTSRTANSLMGLKRVEKNRHRDWSLPLTADRTTMFIVISFTKQHNFYLQFLFRI